MTELDWWYSTSYYVSCRTHGSSNSSSASWLLSLPAAAMRRFNNRLPVAARCRLWANSKHVNKPVGVWISAPSPNIVARATRVGPTTFCMVPLNRPSRKPPSRPTHLRSICHTSRLIGDFVLIWGSKFWALGGLNQKSKNNVLYRGHGELMAKKWLDSIEKQKRISNLNEHSDRQTDRHTYRQTESTTKK